VGLKGEASGAGNFEDPEDHIGPEDVGAVRSRFKGGVQEGQVPSASFPARVRIPVAGAMEAVAKPKPSGNARMLRWLGRGVESNRVCAGPRGAGFGRSIKAGPLVE